MTAAIKLAARPAFEGLVKRLDANGACIVERDGLGIATLQARKGRSEALRQRVRDGFGTELPAAAVRAASGEVAFACIARDTWIATCEGAGNSFAPKLAQLAGDAGSVADQSDGYAVLRLSGPRTRALLARLVPVDVHERAFAVGAVASTVAGHMGVTFWRLPDDAAGPAFDLVLYRSFAASFARMLAECVRAMGVPGS